MRLKALILAGGRGNRVRDYTQKENKCMLEFQGKRLIEYSLENAVKLNVNEIIIVVGYMAERIINAYGNSFKGTPIRYIIQWEQKGLVHAIECSRNNIDNSDFFLFLGDEFLVNPDHTSMFKMFSSEEVFAVCGVVKTNDPALISKTYAILFDRESHQIIRFIEKPRNPINNLMGTGNCIFKNEILNYIEHTPVNQVRQEKELPDLIQCAVDDGRKVFFHNLTETYVNVNTPEDLTIINNMKLGKDIIEE